MMVEQFTEKRSRRELRSEIRQEFPVELMHQEYAQLGLLWDDDPQNTEARKSAPWRMPCQ